MSKIGRRPIRLHDVQVEIKGLEIHYKGKNAAGVHEIPPFLEVGLEGDVLTLSMKGKARQHKKFWGLHRALLANKIFGAHTNFEKKLVIKGLGYKAEVSGKKVKLSLGYSHKIDYELPEGVTLETDKTGQSLTARSANKELLGLACDQIRSFRPPEPYKGTGIRLADEIIIRKAGKAKS